MDYFQFDHEYNIVKGDTYIPDSFVDLLWINWVFVLDFIIEFYLFFFEEMQYLCCDFGLVVVHDIRDMVGCVVFFKLVHEYHGCGWSVVIVNIKLGGSIFYG